MSDTQETSNVISLHEQPKPAMPIHVMVDLETLGMGENAIVLSIGAVVFSKDGFSQEFYAEIDPAKYPGSVDLDTIKFWMNESSVGNLAPMTGIITMPQALELFHNWLISVCELSGCAPSDLRIWANGTDFDLPKLQYMYKAVGVKPAWTYNSVRDCRTIYKMFSLYGLEPDRSGKHNALMDARWQAEYLVSILNNLEELCDVSEFYS